MRSCGSRRRASAARTCTSTRCSARSSIPATSSATSRWAIVEEVGAEVEHIEPGDRVVIPFNISCGHCYTCGKGLQSQCETTQVRDYGTGAALLGYTKLYGQVPGGQAEYLRVPQAHYGPIKVPEGPPDDRFVYLSDVLPTAWQAVEYADVPDGEARARARPRSDRRDVHADRPAPRRRDRCIGVDLVPERLERARSHGVETLDLDHDGDLPEAVRELTDGRGPISVIDAVGMEAHGSPVGKLRAAARRAAAGRRRAAGRSRRPGSTGSPHCTWRSSSSSAAGRSRCRASTAAPSARCR